LVNNLFLSPKVIHFPKLVVPPCSSVIHIIHRLCG